MSRPFFPASPKFFYQFDIMDYAPDGVLARSRSKDAKFLFHQVAWDSSGNVIEKMESLLHVSTDASPRVHQMRFILDTGRILESVSSFGVWIKFMNLKTHRVVPFTAGSSEISNWDDKYTRKGSSNQAKEIRGSFINILGGNLGPGDPATWSRQGADYFIPDRIKVQGKPPTKVQDL